MAQSDKTWCGVVQEVTLEARHRRANKPQPWIVLKFAVGLTILIVGYSAYVYAGRFCHDMIVKSGSALGDQATGLAFLVVYCLLLFMMAWSYLVVITTTPGNARKYTQTTTRPGYDRHTDRSSSLNSADVRGTSYELMSPTPVASHPLAHEPSKKLNPQSSLRSGNSQTMTSQMSAAASSVAKAEQSSHSQASIRGPEEAHITDGIGAPESPQIADTTMLPTHANPSESSPGPAPPMFSRRPTTTPILLPEYRYCGRCQIVKPPRTHHCRACGTCILKYDHHCPWIGQCVGAFNQKFFINFLQWGTMYCFWTFATLLGLNVKPRPPSASAIDPQQIVVIALAGFFGIFFFLVLVSQLHLALQNQTTVESLNSRSMRDREQETLSHMYRWYQIGPCEIFSPLTCRSYGRAKRRTRKQWDNEWGRIGIEGNLWWLGSRTANWEAVMGKSVLRWFFPVGRPLGDGMNFPMNPRFDSVGRWRRRKEWPTELQ